jgi:hypothetical protein
MPCSKKGAAATHPNDIAAALCFPCPIRSNPNDHTKKLLKFSYALRRRSIASIPTPLSSITKVAGSGTTCSTPVDCVNV